jgi:hypothetical protein
MCFLEEEGELRSLDIANGGVDYVEIFLHICNYTRIYIRIHMYIYVLYVYKYLYKYM